MRTLALAVLALALAGCAFSQDIVMRDQQGREATCEGVTGLGGVWTNVLLSVQRRCIDDYQHAGYERVPVPRP